MKAFLLTAGLGTRLQPITDKIPKCLVPINGKPLLQIWLDLCRRHGVSEVLINSHHLSHLVEEYFKVNGYSLSANKDVKPEDGQLTKNLLTNERKGLKVILSYESILLGSAGTLLSNRDFVENEDEFSILYGDNLTNANLTELIKFHRIHGDLLTMGLFKTEKPSACGIAELDQRGKVISFEEKPKNPKTNFAAAGIYVASPGVFDFFPGLNGNKVEIPLDLGFDVFPRLIGHMYGYLINDYLLDIGDMASYQKAQREWPTILNPS